MIFNTFILMCYSAVIARCDETILESNTLSTSSNASSVFDSISLNNNTAFNEISSNVSTHPNSSAASNSSSRFDFPLAPNVSAATGGYIENFTVPEYVSRLGYTLEKHHVTTEDGYILEMHRLPVGLKNTNTTNRYPVLLHHGLFSSSADYLMGDQGKALGIMMVEAGYDVWMANCRGNQYSRNHTSLNPDEDASFWYFSFDEIAIYDLPAEIDYILNVTGYHKIVYGGYSLGTTVFFSLMSEKPQYNKKVEGMAAMAPVAFLGNATGVAKTTSPLAEQLDLLLHVINHNEIMTGHNPLVHQYLPIGKLAPYSLEMQYAITALDVLAGPDNGQLNQDILGTCLSLFPAGSSVHNLLHFAQEMVSGKFCKFDKGVTTNMVEYGQATPPDYDLTKVTTPVALFHGQYDFLANVKDVEILKSSLTNLVQVEVIDDPPYNHLHFIWGKRASSLVYQKVLNFFDSYVKNLP